MASGHPDYLDWAGRTVFGPAMSITTFTGAVAAGNTGVFNLPVVAEDAEAIYKAITVSCNDDTAIHIVRLLRVSDDFVFFRANFVLGEIFDFPGIPLGTGEQIQVQITNNSASTLTFEGTVNYVERVINLAEVGLT